VDPKASLDGCRKSRPRTVEPVAATLSWPLLKVNTVELHLSGLIGTASHPDMQKIRIIGFFCENTPHWESEVRLLLFTVCTCV